MILFSIIILLLFINGKGYLFNMGLIHTTG
jgi:hypothetical protein